jgi:prepilin-type processing-associated H-X9-DG protein
MPKVYAIPGKTNAGDTSTHYRVFVGNGAGFDWVQGARFPAAFSDGTSNTLMCITAETSVPWTKPDELEFDPDKDMTRLAGLVVNGRFQFAMFDGSVRTLARIPAKATLNALITRAGGEVIPGDFDK